MRRIRVVSWLLLLVLLNTALADGLEMPTVQEKNEVFNGNQAIESDGIEVYSLRTDLESQEGFYDELNSGLGEILPDIELEIEQPEAQAVEGEQTGGLVTSAIIDATTVTAYYEGHGYRIFNEALTWTEAKVACEAKGGHLATITGKGENYFVKSLIEANPAKDKYHFWLGGTDAAEEGTWRWVTGEAWNYSAWESGQPNNDTAHDSTGQDYLELKNIPGRALTWNDEPNDGYSPYSPEGPDYYSLPYYGYVCEWDGERDESPCGKLQRYKGNRYQVFNAAMTWKQAEAACEKAGGHLVVITSEDENSFIKELILSNPASGKYHYWIGGSDSEKEGVWQWVTGEPWDYTYWEPDQPNNDTAHDSTGQDYLEIKNIPGRELTWNDEPNDGCSPYSPDAPDYYSEPYYGYICEWEGEAKSLKKAVVTPGYTETVYNGKAKKPSVTVELNGKTLKKNTDYRVTYKNNTNIGTATVKVTGIGSYKGSASAMFRIVPATPKLKAVSEEAGKAELSVGRVAGATGYEFRWKRTNASKENTMSTTSLTISISRLKTGAKYAFRARAYGEVSGERVYGSFCSAKTVTISKDAPKVIPVTSITLNHTQALLQKGGSLQLTATVKPNDATNKEVEWTSSNAGVASVDANGKVTGKKAGKATVTAKAKDGSGVSASCEVNVGTASLTADTWNLGFGEPVQLKVNSPAKKAAVTYSVDDPAIARVNGKGVVTAGNKEGETTVRARITLGNTSLSAEHKLWVWGSNKNKGFTGMLLTEIKKEVNDKLLNAYDKFYSAMTGKMESTQTTLKNKVEASVAIQVAYGSMFNVTKKEQQAFKEAFSSQIDPDKLQASDYSKCKTSMDLVNAIAKLLMNGTKGEYVYYVNGKPYRMKITKIPSWGAAYVQGTVLFPNGKELVWGGTEVSTESIKDQLDYLRLYGKVKVSEAEKKVKETIKQKTVELLDIDWLTKAAKDCISGSTKKWVKENYYSLYQYAEGLGKVAKAYNDLNKALKGLKPADMSGKLTLDVVRTVAGYGKKVQTFTETVESLGDTLKI